MSKGIGAWERTEPYITVGIPHTGHVTMEWAVNLKALKIPGGQDMAYYYYSRGGTIEIARNESVDGMLENDSEWLFFLDSDVIAPPDAIQRLMSYGLPIVSGMYYVRGPKQGALHPCCWKLKPDTDGSGKTDYQPVLEFGFGALLEVDACGAGCLLIHRSVLEKMKEKGIKYFEYTSDHKGNGMGEDFDFCHKAQQLGYKVMVDPTVMCEHLNITKVVYPGTIDFARV